MRIYSRDTNPTPIPGIRVAERERPATLHHAVHTSREAAETRVDKHAEFNANRVLANTYLEAPPPRPGFKQRWIKDGSHDAADDTAQRNWWLKKRQGWQVRDPETVPEELRHLYPSTHLGSGQDAIRVASQVLCEMPVNVMHQRSMAIRDLIARQNSSVSATASDDLRKKPLRGARPMEVDESVHAARGQNPELRGRSLATMSE